VTDRHLSRLFTILQILVDIGFLVFLLFDILGAKQAGAETFISAMMNDMPYIVVLLFSLLPTLMLRIRHRAQTSEGYLLPLYFMFLGLTAVSIFPSITARTGDIIMKYSTNEILARFTLLSSAITLFFCGQLNLRTGVAQKVSLYLSLSLLAALIISLIAPTSSDPTHANPHTTCLGYLSIVIFLIAFVTYMLEAIKDKAASNIQRFVSISFVAAGHCFLLFSPKTMSFAVATIIIFLTGVVFLCIWSNSEYY